MPEAKYLDSIFRGVSVDSAPIKDMFGKNFVAKKFMTPFEFSNGQFDCSAENFFMGAYGLLLARFAGADEVFFTATGAKKIPVYLNFSPEQNLADYLKSLREQIERSREIICTPYEEIAKAYDFPTAPEFISAPQEISGKSFALAVAENIPTR